MDTSQLARFSIVTTTWNRIQFLREVIASVRSQDYTNYEAALTTKVAAAGAAAALAQTIASAGAARHWKAARMEPQAK